MSMWTHITSCMSVDTATQSNDLLNVVKKNLENAPKITGSESDADIYINLQSGYNTWTDRDCDRCEYGNSVHSVDKQDEELNVYYDFECNAPDGYECPDGRYQTCVVISIQGDLRDRTKQQTQEEFDAFKKFIEEEYILRDYSVNIEGDC